MLNIKPPALVLYTERMIPARFAGFTIGALVLIRPFYRDDAGLLVHELTHVKQFWRSLGLSLLLYQLSKTWRLRFEVEAYRAQMACYPDDRSVLFAGFLVTRYGLKITQDEAVQMLEQK